MSLLVFRDHEGDRVVIDHEHIVGLRVGQVDGIGLLTLISTSSATFGVRDQLADVEEAWRTARGESRADFPEPTTRAHPNTIGWERQYEPEGSHGVS